MKKTIAKEYVRTVIECPHCKKAFWGFFTMELNKIFTRSLKKLSLADRAYKNFEID